MAASTSAAATTTASARAVHFSKRLDMADLTHTDGRDAWRHDGEDGEYRAHSRYSKPLDPGLSQLRSGSLSPTPAERSLVRELAPANDVGLVVTNAGDQLPAAGAGIIHVGWNEGIHTSDSGSSGAHRAVPRVCDVQGCRRDAVGSLLKFEVTTTVEPAALHAHAPIDFSREYPQGFHGLALPPHTCRAVYKPNRRFTSHCIEDAGQ